MLRLTASFLLMSAAMAHAATITVNVPEGGPYFVWMASAPGEPGAKAVRTRASSIDLDTANFAGAKFVYVADETSNKLAKVPYKPGSDTINLTAKDFGRLFKAEVKVVRSGSESPIDAGILTTEGQTVLLTPASEGTAVFYDLPTGPAKIKLEYNLGKTKAIPITQEVDFSQPVLMVAAGAVEAGPAPTTESSATPGKAKEKDPKDQPANPIGSMVVTLLGVAVLGGLAYAALRYYQGNSSQVNEQLEKLGVQIPKAPDDDLASADPIPDPTFKRAQPVQKIVLDPVAPVDLGMADAQPMTPLSVMSAASPALLTTDGETLEIMEGETVVGRDAGLGLSLTGETSVSRRHARFVRVGPQVTIEDLGSTNGSFVNGSKLTASTVLRPGDQIQFGAISFRYQG